jgi:hypothetical protein
VLGAVGESIALSPLSLPLPGRYADSAGLNLAAVGVHTDPSNGKILCVNEQTSVPSIYAIGDIVHGAPELTPAAIKVPVPTDPSHCL